MARKKKKESYTAWVPCRCKICGGTFRDETGKGELICGYCRFLMAAGMNPPEDGQDERVCTEAQ